MDNRKTTLNQPAENLDLLDAATLSKMVENSENPLDKLTQKNHDGISPLEKAQKEKNQALLNSYYQIALEYYHNTLIKDVDTTTVDNAQHRRTILFWAIACFQKQEVIAELLSKGSKVHETYYDEQFAEFPAFKLILTLGNVPAIKAFFNSCTKEEAKSLALQPLNRNGVTPAHVVAEHGHTEILQELFHANNNVIRTSIPSSELTPLHVAAKQGHAKTATWLLDHDAATLDKPDASGFTALHYAVMDQRIDTARVLLNHRANVDLATKKHARRPDKTALQLAADTGNNEMVRLLMQHGAKPDEEHHHRIDTVKLVDELRIAFELYNYTFNRDKGDTYNHTLFGYNLNPKAWPKETKIAAAEAVIKNIVNNVNPLANLSSDHLGALKDSSLLGDSSLKTITEPLFKKYGTKGSHSSPTTPKTRSPSPNRSNSEN